MAVGRFGVLAESEDTVEIGGGAFGYDSQCSGATFTGFAFFGGAVVPDPGGGTDESGGCEWVVPAVQIQNQWAAENSADSVLLATFHPSYSYEDFVEGWRPDPEAAGGFKLARGVLLEAVERARGDPTLLIVDEINRGDVARIFGEFVTFIEHDKRGIEFTTAQNPKQRHRIPKNLFLLGTMNTADKSINLLDMALRRRFTFVQCPPDPEVFDRSPGLIGAIDGIQLKELLTTINQRLADHQVETDRQIGHGMLCIPVDSSDPMQELLDRLCYSILPLVAEYLYGEPDRIQEVLPGLIDDRGLPKRPDEVSDLRVVLGDTAPTQDDHENGPETGNNGPEGPPH